MTNHLTYQKPDESTEVPGERPIRVLGSSNVVNIKDAKNSVVKVSAGIHNVQYFSEIVNLLRKNKPSIFGDTTKNHSGDICQKLDELARLLGDRTRKDEAISFLESFETVENITKLQVNTFLEGLYEIEDFNIENLTNNDSPPRRDKPVQYRSIEIIRALFVAFGITEIESVGGRKQKPSNPILKLYDGYVADKYIRRLNFGSDTFTDFVPEITQEAIFLGLREDTPLVHPSDLIKTITDAVEGIRINENGYEGNTPIKEISKDNQDPRPSWKRLGAERRRMKDKRSKVERNQEELQKEKEREYEQRVQEFKSYGEEVKSELQRLQSFLLMYIPYTTEVLDFLHLERRLKQEGYIEEGESIGDAREQILGTIESLESDCSESRSTIHVLEAEISGLSSSLIQVNSDGLNNGTKVKVIQKQLYRKTARIKKERSRLVEIEVELQRISSSVEDVISQLQGFRFKHGVPNIDEFEAGIYYSLDAGNIYSMPERINQPPVTVQWIEQNIFRIFKRILGGHFEWKEISIIAIWELLEKIDELETDYSDDTTVPEFEVIDLNTIKDFIDTLLTIIPQKYLEEIPVFGEGRFKLVTPEIFIWNPPNEDIMEEAKNEKHIPKFELRNKKNEKLKEKTEIRSEIQEIDNEMAQYKQYWFSRMRSQFRKKRAIESDIKNIKSRVAWRVTNRGKTIEELEDLYKITEEEFLKAQGNHKDESLLQDESAYDELEKRRGTLQKKLQRLK